MTTLAQNDIVLLIVALLIGMAVGFWLYRSRRRSPHHDPAPFASNRSLRVDAPEGNAVTDEFAAATKDVAGEILGVEIPAAAGPADDLRMLKGVGPKLAAQLNANGIIRYDQLAGLSGNEVARLDEHMGAFSGRIVRDRLVEQACFLARGDRDGFEATFGKLGGGA
jgi:predicted flap endonuclease-1-like 5' DNA nuclease